jgi:hypothetical protein
MRSLLFAIALGLCAGGCSTVEPDPVPQFLITPIQIERVDVRILESSPPQATAHVEGVIGDGCTELNSERQVRSGSTVTITVLAQRPPNAICTQVAKLYRKDIPLEGAFPPGPYILSVNGVEKAFTTQ